MVLREVLSLSALASSPTAGGTGVLLAARDHKKTTPQKGSD
jgi:hypothetical protein